MHRALQNYNQTFSLRGGFGREPKVPSKIDLYYKRFRIISTELYNVKFYRN